MKRFSLLLAGLMIAGACYSPVQAHEETKKENCKKEAKCSKEGKKCCKSKNKSKEK